MTLENLGKLKILSLSVIKIEEIESLTRPFQLITSTFLKQLWRDHYYQQNKS
jgi:hypothetical protein